MASDAKLSALKKELCEELVQSGKYAELSALLRQRLEAAGWIAHVGQLSEAAANGSNWPDIDALCAQIEPHAQRAVPSEIRQEFEKQCEDWMRAQITDDRLAKLI